MRLSTQYMFKQSIDSMSRRINENNDAYMKVSAGKTLLSASDNPVGATNAVMYQDALAKMEIYSNARSTARGSMEQTDSTLSSIGNLLTKNLSQKLVAAQTETMSEDDRKALATEIEGIRKNLMDLANSRDGGGRYIFSGYKSDTAPFDAAGNYQGGDRAISQTVEQGSEMKVGYLGSEIFMSGSGTDLFKALDEAVAQLNKGGPVDNDLRDALGQASKAVDAGIGSLGKVQAELGTNLQRLDELDLRGDTDRNAMIDKLQAAVGSDYGTQIGVITDSKMAEFSLNASMMVFQAMQKMNIFTK
ncbi:flagellar hook-associated protein FlgL [Dryocola sp. BD626]|uniref:flagellar hook-associated protein FlgL n=1 Tax=Dryocola sp. BD626 TaxID=3133273 RepID=UPI003F4FDB1E